MTAIQKEEIILLRGGGASYAEIAEKLGLNAATIKTFCTRKESNPKSPAAVQKKTKCAFCNASMNESCQPSRRFCCDACRMAWWKAHPKQINRKAVYHFTCPICHKPFTAYGNSHRIYCSSQCYGKSRTKAVKS